MTQNDFCWETFLGRHRDAIVTQWRLRLKAEVSEQYARRSLAELTLTTGKACDSFCQMIAQNNDGPINEFISEITKIRLGEGFPLHDVQKAFELYRQIVIPILIEESPPEMLCRNIEAVNQGLAYTIHRFSYHFQKVHETYLQEYAHQLERDVAARTAELKESEHKYKTLVEDISDGYLVLDREIIVFVNPAFCRMHGHGSETTLYQSFLAFVSGESRDRVEKIIMREVKAGAEPETFEYQRLTRSGKSLPSEISFRSSRYGGRDYNLCIVRDITRRVEMEKRNREVERMAYIGKLTTSLSHEIRNPLSSVKMNLQILGKNHQFKGNDRKRLEISEKEIRRLEGILKELLDFAKPVSLKPSEIDLNQIVRACADLLEVRFSKRGIQCDVHPDERLPGFRADRGKVEQVIINLLLNALDSVDDFGHIRISTGKRRNRGRPCVMVRVEDDGRGIPKAMRSQIFEPFYTTRAAGTGLGLSNVKQITKAHGGVIRVGESKYGGALFEVLLPMEVSDD